MDTNKYIQYLAIQNFKNAFTFEGNFTIKIRSNLNLPDKIFEEDIALPALLVFCLNESLKSEVNCVEVYFAGRNFFDCVHGEINYNF